ncbi:energy-coupling factor ABC transporter ATP-binding protein [Paenibacillus daejeonensis]|uniref:energy-coupling factor ABC transporter ATP-binding protein n=1 Tax=Paenibacillus daejeonensis TaxID=135193 RepID=UPI00036EC8FD|nr:ABC transporter ATP-binding protein [Paenibacillus daejeonensis]
MNTQQLELRQVSVLYSDPGGAKKRHLLVEINLTIRQGEWLQIAGANGSGKSTLVKLLTGQLGRHCIVEGSVIKGFVGERPIPYVLQHPEAGILGATPWEDVLLGLEQRGVDQQGLNTMLPEVLKQTGLTSLLHEPVARMSGGQKQLTAMASVLAAKPPMLVLDEPTSMLDPEGRAEVLAVVRELNRAGMTVVWVTHRQQEWEPGDRILALQGGRLIFDGRPEGFYTVAEGETQSPCERMDWNPPYAVQTALALQERGLRLTPLPLNAAQLAEAVSR